MIKIKSIWESHIPTDEIIVKTQIENIKLFKCYAATNHKTGNHLFIFETSKAALYPDFKTFKFKGLFIEIFEFKNSKELHIYLLDNQLKDIFSLFIENIVEEISKSVTENEALKETSNVVFKWKKLFDKINFQGLSIEMQKGLIGELLFFNSLLDEDFPIDLLLECWTGPDFNDKDYRFGAVGIEVKLTASKNPSVKISSERQLEIDNLTKLFLVLYVVEEVKDKGFSLNSLIDQIRMKIKNYQETLKFFNERLLLIGYLDEDFDNYNRLYAFRKRNFYEIENQFPKLVESDLENGLFDVKYNIELSSIEKYLVNEDSMKELIKQWKED